MSPVFTDFKIVALLLLSARLAFSETFCTFYSDDYCEKRSGSVNYAIENDGVFQNGGAYFKCKSSEELSLISYPAGDSNGDHPKHCHVFPSFQATDQCNHLDSLGFTTGDGGYYRLSTSKTCPPTSEKRDAAVAKLSRRGQIVDARNARYFRFYDDPECKQQSGGVGYSIGNQGCFENGGAYGRLDGDTYNFHIEQYDTTGNQQCSGSITHCVDGGKFAYNDNESIGCFHLDDVGLHTGFGSYKIVANSGCP